MYAPLSPFSSVSRKDHSKLQETKLSAYTKTLDVFGCSWWRKTWAGWGHGCCWRERGETGTGRHGGKMGPGPGALSPCKLEFSALLSQEWPEQILPRKKTQKNGQPREGCVRPPRLALLKEVCPGLWEALSASKSLSLTSGLTATQWNKVRCYPHLPSHKDGRSQRSSYRGREGRAGTQSLLCPSSPLTSGPLEVGQGKLLPRHWSGRH